jgi:hypothetical protein
MAGRWEDIGGRRTFLPPFVNERFDGPPYWACTFAALLNGANVAALGELPAGHDEVRALAKASGDPDLRGGSRSSHMVEAVRVRFRRAVRIEALPPAEVIARLASGWALVAGLTYGQLPAEYRRPSPRFTGGHRVTLVGWSAGRTRLLDPLENRDASFGGRWIPWTALEPAWWSREQLWFREGQMASLELRLAEAFPSRRWRVAAGASVEGWSAAAPRTLVRRARFERASAAGYDAIVHLVSRDEGAAPLSTYMRVSSGLFDGQLIDVASPGITLEPGEAAGLGAGTGPGGAAGFGAGRQHEWDRISAHFGDKVHMPPRP